jgi:hypothetical protein
MKVNELKEGWMYEDYSKSGHCKNGTFHVSKWEDGVVVVIDTYFNSGIEATDEFVKDFKPVFKIDDVELISIDEAKLYEESEIFIVPFDSGGYMTRQCFKNKKAEKSDKLILELLEERVQNAERELKYSKEKLERYKNGELNKKYIN